MSDMSSMERLEESADEEEGIVITDQHTSAKPESENGTVCKAVSPREGIRRSRRNRGVPGGSVVRQGAIDLDGKRGDTVVIEMVNGEEVAAPTSGEDSVVIAPAPEEVDVKKLHSCAEHIVANHVEVRSMCV